MHQSVYAALNMTFLELGHNKNSHFHYLCKYSRFVLWGVMKRMGGSSVARY
jgi:hypothetical protein